MHKQKSIGIIGAGSIAEAMLDGILDEGILLPENIYITNKSNDDRLEFFRESYGVNTTRDYKEILSKCRYLIIAVKPADIGELLAVLKKWVTMNHIIITLAAGITTDFAIDHLENVKGEITNIEVTVLDSRFLIQCSLNIHLFYAGRDGVIYSQKAVFPFGIFEDIKEGRPDMRVRVKPRISGIKTELVAMKTVSIIFMLNFELLATVEEDIYLVTAVSKDHIKTRQVFYEDYKFNVNHFLPLSSPLLMMKDVKAQTQKIWLDRNNSGSWAVGVLSISSSYVGKDHLIHQDFDQLDFRIKIPDMENVGPNQIIVCAKPSKIVSNTDSEMVEVEFEINIRVFSFVEIQ